MDLILWRHAEAVPTEEGLTDSNRPLTLRGERQAKRMSQWLERQLPEGAKVFCSPTVRTQQTVLPLGRKFKLRDEISPQGTVEHALELAQWPTAKNTVVMGSHQPLIGQMVSLLFGLPSHEMMIKKGSVWWIRYKIKDEQPQITLLTVQSPELL